MIDDIRFFCNLISWHLSVIRGKRRKKPNVDITGDAHGQFDRIELFCRAMEATKADTMMIPGDAGSV